MTNKTNWFLKNLHLLISLSIVVPAAIIYGTPHILSKLLDIQSITIDLLNLLKALMALYLGISIVWILGIWKEKYWKNATQLNVLFMIALASGRTLSILTDGLPSGGFIFGTIGEFILGIFSIYQLKKYSSKLN